MRIHDNIYENIRTRVIVTYQNEMVLMEPGGPAEGWQLPGGGLEFDESLADCGEREVLEETGLVVKVSGVAFIREYVVPKYCIIPGQDRQGFHLEIFLYTQPLTERPDLSKEHPTAPQPHWIPFEQIPAMPLWPKELKTLAMRMAAGEIPHGIPSFLAQIENPSTPAPPVDFF